MNAVTAERLLQLQAIVGDELQRALFGEMPKFCMAFNMPADPIVEVANRHSLPQEEVEAVAWHMNAQFASRARWPD